MCAIKCVVKKTKTEDTQEHTRTRRNTHADKHIQRQTHTNKDRHIQRQTHTYKDRRQRWSSHTLTLDDTLYYTLYYTPSPAAQRQRPLTGY